MRPIQLDRGERMGDNMISLKAILATLTNLSAQSRLFKMPSEENKPRSITLKDFGIEESAFELGEVSFHSGWTFNRAGGNTTDRPREVMTVICMDRDARLLYPVHKNQQNDREWWCPGLTVGQAIASSLNPIVFSETK